MLLFDGDVWGESKKVKCSPRRGCTGINTIL
jgi:hypothetical protein